MILFLTIAPNQCIFHPHELMTQELKNEPTLIVKIFRSEHCFFFGFFLCSSAADRNQLLTMLLGSWVVLGAPALSLFSFRILFDAHQLLLYIIFFKLLFLLHCATCNAGFSHMVIARASKMCVIIFCFELCSCSFNYCELWF